MVRLLADPEHDACGEGDDLKGDVPPGRQAGQVLELPPHDGRAPHLRRSAASSCTTVSAGGSARASSSWRLSRKLEQAFYLLVAKLWPPVAVLVAELVQDQCGVLLGLQQAVDEAVLVGPDGGADASCST